MSIGTIILIPALLLIFYIISYTLYSVKSRQIVRKLRFRDMRGVRKLLNKVVPKEGTKKCRELEDKLFYLDYNLRAEVFYLFKIVCVSSMILIMIAVTTTNIISRRVKVFQEQATGEGSINYFIDKDLYDDLSHNLTFEVEHVKGDDGKAQLVPTEENKKQLKYNVERANLSDKYPEQVRDQLYMKLVYMHKSLHSVFSILDVLVFIIMCLLAWFTPNFILKIFMSAVKSKKQQELYNLETLIYLKIKTSYKMRDIIESLVNSSFVYREFLRSFYYLHEVNPDRSYAVILNNPNFPKELMKLVRFLQNLEKSGPVEVIKKIETDQKIIEPLIKERIERANRRRGKLLNIYGVAMVVASTIYVAVKVASQFDFSAMGM